MECDIIWSHDLRHGLLAFAAPRLNAPSLC